jgi:hypothetical protein
MKTVKLISFIFLMLLVITAGCCFYYYYPRKVSFKFVVEIPKPDERFDNSEWLSYDYIRNENELMFFLVDYYKKESCIKNGLIGYDSAFIQNFGKTLNFDKYDYAITFHKQLKALTYSPYLANNFDDCGFMEEKPLFPTFDTVITDKVYIYQIKKNKKYRRAPCP